MTGPAVRALWGSRVQTAARTVAGKQGARGRLRSNRGGCYHWRQRARLGAPQKITAAAHKLARIVYHLVRCGMAYVKQTEAEYVAHVRERLAWQLHRRAHARDSG